MMRVFLLDSLIACKHFPSRVENQMSDGIIDKEVSSSSVLLVM